MKSKYHIDNIELNLHARSMLERLEIYNIRDLEKWHRDKFSRTKGIGPQILHEVDNVMDTYGLKWREPISLSREEMIEDIKDVLNYRDGNYYVGSLACAHVCSLLNQSYGHHNFDIGLKNANDEQIKKVYEYLLSYIDHMKENPVTVCLVCHSIVRKEKINSDYLIVKFQKGYVDTLIKQVGVKKAKKRLFEEGKVALKLEIDKLEK